MKGVGSALIFFGAFAIVLNFFDRVPSILIWIYSWGDVTAWIIKIGLIVVGLVLYFIGSGKAAEPEEGATEGDA